MKKFWLLIAILSCSLFSVRAQHVNTLYFLENSPHRHFLNPALTPISNMYLSLPAIGYTSLSVGNNSLTLSDIIYNNNGQTVTFLHPELGDTPKFLDRLRNATAVDADIQLSLLAFGFRVKDNGYFHFTLNERIETGVGLPKGLFNFALGGGLYDLNGINTFDLSQLGLNASVYTELGIGYTHAINEQWSVGGKLKFNYGHAYAGLRNEALDLNASIDEWNLKGSGYAMIAAPITGLPASLAPADIQNMQIGFPENLNGSIDIMSMLKPQGLGAGVDLGMTYKPHEQVQISASVTDLGFIVWNKGTRYNYNLEGSYTGVGELRYEDYVDETGAFNTDQLMDTVTTRLTNVYQTAMQAGETEEGFTRMTTPRLNIGVDANFWENRVGVGVYSQTKFANSRVYEEVTLGAAFRPCHWFQIAASYSFVNGKWSNVGAALGLVTYEGIGLTLAADYIPCTYADYVTETASIPIPYKTKGINLAFGLNIVIGHKQDKDKDGVQNKFDLCPETPRGVKVDDFGCPIDSDGDGVPDYLDECPGTPAAAYGYVDEVGCPIDTDGDSVPDYLDLCPNTPMEAYGYVDSCGCELDTDGDGVYDYKDECPGTPAAARGFVDERGCLLDTDGDSVPDYLDLCPNTPAEARGFVDSCGCELDTDDDGVFDYKDECPNTPAGARGFVDERGCALDTDGDGVPDFKDQCPNTPAEARGFVNEFGCELDTDGDGVPDYKDNCPTVAGSADNNGCPSVKREVRNLLKRAMQGIQFETGKAVIKKSSYKMLNQIAQIFIDNPTYKVEVQGHTDNTGNDELNMALSDKRANAVRDYLIKQGVPENQLTAKGYGETMPIATNKTSKGRALNRRVEFVITFEEVKVEEVKYTNDSTYTVTEMSKDTVDATAPVMTAPVVVDSTSTVIK